MNFSTYSDDFFNSEESDERSSYDNNDQSKDFSDRLEKIFDVLSSLRTYMLHNGLYMLNTTEDDQIMELYYLL